MVTKEALPTALSQHFTTVLNRDTGTLETINILTGDVVSSTSDSERYVYSDALADAICNIIREGKTLQDVAKLEGMPPIYLLLTWSRKNKYFRMEVAEAEKDRARLYHDRAAKMLDDLADNPLAGEEEDGDLELKRKKLVFDGMLKLAEKGDPDRYQQKAQSEQQGGSRVLIINTGLPSVRVGQNSVVEIEAEVADGARGIGERAEGEAERLLEACGAGAGGRETGEGGGRVVEEDFGQPA